jgi:hypothetical protein
MLSKVDLRPAALLPQMSNAPAESRADITCHGISMAISFRLILADRLSGAFVFLRNYWRATFLEVSVKKVHVLFALCALCTVLLAKDEPLSNVKVEVVQGSEGIETFGKTMTTKKSSMNAVSLKAIVNGDHVMLTCYEQHRGCTFMAPGTYDGELKLHSGGHIHWSTGHDGMDPDLWISFSRPLDHAMLREHYKISGSW